MPHRFVSLAILFFWAIAAGALFSRDLLPNLLIGSPPDMRAVARVEDTGRPTKWAIMVADRHGRDGEVELRSVGQAVTVSERKQDGDFMFRSDAWVDWAGLFQGTPVESPGGGRIEIGGLYEITSAGNLRHFRAWVRDYTTHHELMSVAGRLQKNALEVEAHGPLPLLNWKKSLPYEPRGMVQNALGPPDRLPGLQVGQRWVSRVVNPVTGRVEEGRVEVARRQVITWDSNPVKTLEVVTRSGPMTARTWARSGDGLILRQEIPLPLVTLIMERVPSHPRPSSPSGGDRR